MNRFLQLMAGISVWGWFALANAGVDAQLSQDRVDAGRPVQLRLEASGSGLSMPDLTPLQADFQIANRNLRQQSSTINGHRSQRIGLTLTLVPMRSGTLQIPALRFGNQTSSPLRLKVIASSEEQTPAQAFSPVPVWNAQPSYGPAAPAGWNSRSSPSNSYKPANSYSTSPSGGAGVAENQSGSGIPALWIALGLGLLVFLGLFRRGVRRLSASGGREDPPPPPPAVEPRPLSPRLGAIRDAYAGGDAEAARKALLAWAGEQWPGDAAPINLSRLAGRLEGPAKEAVLRLDQALYSPSPLGWDQLKPWEHLA